MRNAHGSGENSGELIETRATLTFDVDSDIRRWKIRCELNCLVDDGNDVSEMGSCVLVGSEEGGHAGGHGDTSGRPVQPASRGRDVRGRACHADCRPVHQLVNRGSRVSQVSCSASFVFPVDLVGPASTRAPAHLSRISAGQRRCPPVPGAGGPAVAEVAKTSTKVDSTDPSLTSKLFEEL